MAMLLAQIFLLMLAAFLVGAMLGCLLKHVFFGTAAERGEAAATVPAAATTSAPAPIPPQRTEASTRFERALTGEGKPMAPAVPAPQQAPRAAVPVVEVQPKPAPPPSQSSQPAVPVVEVKPAPPPAPPQPAPVAAKPEPPKPAVVEVKPAPPPPTPAPAPPVAAPAPIRPSTPPPATTAPVSQPAQPADASANAAAAAAAVAAAAAAVAARAAEAKPVAAPAPSPAAPTAPSTQPFGTVARPAAEVKDLAPKPVAPAPVTPVAAPAPAPAPVPAPQPVTAAAPAKPAEPARALDDLTRIRAIDPALQARLNSLGITRFAEIANWVPADVARMSQSLGFAGRIERENWIEQAQILARGIDTDYSRRKATVVAPAAPMTAAAAPAAPPAPAIPASGDAAAAAAAAVAAASAVASRVAAQTGPDRLHRIIGLNAEAEKILNQNGVTRFAQIASWSAPDAERFDRLLGGRTGRIAEENWIEQARILAQGGEPPAVRPVKLAEAISQNQVKPASDLSGLRSVRSEALRGDTRGIGHVDDLKRVRGIGVLIEKKLASLGITAYEQIANWTSADIDRISQILDFKGRIERENWVEQARILASGGHTEFSRRVDRGEVDTSR